MSHQLVALRGPLAGTVFPLSRERTILGRDAQCDIAIPSESVARRQAALTLRLGACWIECLPGEQRTYLNGRPVEQPEPLGDGARLGLGETVLEYRRHPPPPPLAQRSLKLNHAVAVGADTHDDDFVAANTEEKLRALLRITRSLGRTLDLHELSEQTLDNLFEIFPQAQRGQILLQGASGLAPAAARSRDGRHIESSIDQQVVAQAIGQCKAILGEVAGRDAGHGDARDVGRSSTGTMIAAPLLGSDGATIGLVQLETRDQRHHFDADDLEILLSVANQVAVCVEFARQHQRLIGQVEIQKELELAARVQRSLLPRGVPQVAGYQFWAHYAAAVQVGGDFYDFIRLPNGNLAAVLGDVCGKGLAAAIMMARASSICQHALLSAPDNLGRAIRIANEALRQQLEDYRFVTLVVVLINPDSHELTAACAGHMSPLLRRRDGSIEEVIAPGAGMFPLGIADAFPAHTITTLLQPGDTVVLYSDGISEAVNSRDECYTSERLMLALAQSPVSDARQTGETILADVARHLDGIEIHDDTTLVAISRNLE